MSRIINKSCCRSQLIRPEQQSILDTSTLMRLHQQRIVITQQLRDGSRCISAKKLLANLPPVPQTLSLPTLKVAETNPVTLVSELFCIFLFFPFYNIEQNLLLLSFQYVGRSVTFWKQKWVKTTGFTTEGAEWVRGGKGCWYPAGFTSAADCPCGPYKYVHIYIFLLLFIYIYIHTVYIR